MANEARLKDLLISLAKAAKISAESEAVLTVEIGVLRETVRALDPTFSENFEHRKKIMIARTSEHTTALSQKFDQIIQLSESGYVC